MRLTQENQFEILKAAYLEKIKEVQFWRDRSIKVTMWIIGIFTTIAGLSLFLNTYYPIIIIPLFALSLISTIYLHKNFNS
ncbi:MAG: hypothetical protein K8S18_04530, partial [Desulfobacula sp.]|nr:hypothetical protein [Desulfobacula sp.]